MNLKKLLNKVDADIISPPSPLWVTDEEIIEYEKENNFIHFVYMTSKRELF